MKLNIDIERQIAQYNYQNAVVAKRRPTSRFVIGSILLHFLSASAVIVLDQPAQPKPEIVEIDYSNAQTADEVSAPKEAPVAQEAAPAVVTAEPTEALPAPVKAEVVPEPTQPVAVTAPVVAKTEPTPAPVQKAQPKTTPAVEQKPAVTKTETVTAVNPEAVTTPKSEDMTPAKEASATPQKAETPETLDDIETPALDDSEVAAAIQEEPKAKVSKADVEKKLEDAEKAQAEKSAALAQQMEQETQSTEAALNDQMGEAESAVAADNAALASQAQARAEALKASQTAQGTQTSVENGSGTAAESAGPGPQAGELRTLDQLRQKPGNPKPQYDPKERLQGQQGAVIYKAFVTKEGLLANFEMLQSSGHRNLDFKTLKALKQWKFYPGQQGWVELPFKWDLKGGPQEMPTLLRRRVSQQN